jgi:hypothetical protein
MRRTVVLGGGHQLRDEDEQHDLPRHIRVRTRPAARSNGYREHGGEIALHRT